MSRSERAPHNTTVVSGFFLDFRGHLGATAALLLSDAGVMFRADRGPRPRVMAVWLTDDELRVLGAAVDHLLPADGDDPGALDAGAVDYIDGLLGAFLFDPPRIWAGGPFSGRTGGDARFGEFTPLTGVDELCWRTRIEGSRGLREREFNGPVVGLQEIYRDGLSALGSDFDECDHEERERRLRANRAFARVVFEHACEGMYGAPEYGGNRDLCGWRSIGFAGDVQPRGWADDEVAGR